jgi:hypothetical protein
MIRQGLVLGCMLMGAFCFAQTTDSFEDFKRKREQEMSSFETEYKKGLDSLREAQNRDFALLLAGKWIEREVTEAPPVLEKPKPETPPMVEDENREAVPVEAMPLPEVEAEPAPEKAPLDVPQDNSLPQRTDDMSDEAPVQEDTYRVQLERAMQGASIVPSMFYGNATWVPAFEEPWPSCAEPMNASTITAYWKKCSELSTDSYLAYFSVQRELLHLSDWGMLSLVNHWSNQEFSDETQATLFKWYMLVQLGYDVRLMYNEGGAKLAYPFRQMFYGLSYIEMNGKSYFLLDDKQEGSFYTYDGSHAGATQVMTLQQNPSAMFPDDLQLRSFDFSFEGKSYHIEIPFNRYRAKYYESIPQTELDFYFAESGASDFASSCNEYLRKAVDGFPSQREQIRFLYALVCSGIPYATDQEQFGFEKFCLPEESLGYAMADCEDRTFLLNYLVRTFTSAATIGLNYPGHVAMAVAIDDVHPEDARFNYKNRTYVYCDPTYIGADVGMMPEVYRVEQPEVFE